MATRYRSGVFDNPRQFNNIIPSSLPTKKYLEKLTSLHDLDLFSLNTDSNINPYFNLPNLKIRSQYYSPHSFHVMKNNLNDARTGIPKFSLFHSNVRSLKRNFESLETQLLNELEYHFSVVGITETKLANSDLPEQLQKRQPTPFKLSGSSLFLKRKAILYVE